MPSSTSARSSASRLQDSAPLRFLARAGFAMNGVLHLLIGGLALAVAFGGSESADQNGALGAVAANPGGVVLLWVIVVGMLALALFQILSTILVTGSDKEAWAERAKEGGKGVAYIAVGATALRFAMGSGGGGGDEASTLSAQLLQTPGGVILLVAIALGVLAIGIYFIVKGAKKKFLDDITSSGRAVTAVGTAGYIAKGIAIAIVGFFFGIAAFTADPEAATGLDGALKSLTELPFGSVLLTIVAIGLVAFGLYCFARARFARL